jgi:hypothetical protein
MSHYLMSLLQRLRIALGFIREGDPNAWQCFVCGGWSDRNECPNHRFRVFREPTTKRPTFIVPPPPRTRR